MTRSCQKCSKKYIFVLDTLILKTLFRVLVEELYLFKHGANYSSHNWKKTTSQVCYGNLGPPNILALGTKFSGKISTGGPILPEILIRVRKF